MIYAKSQKQFAIHNLQDDEYEIFTKDGEFLVVVNAVDEKLAVWREAQDVEFEEIDENSAKVFIDESDQMKSYKPRLNSKLRSYFFDKIIQKYPIYKQNNINELQGYTQDDKDEMWAYIKALRDKSNELERRIIQSFSLKELNQIEMEVNNGNY